MSVVDDIKEWSRENPEVIVGAVVLAIISFLVVRFWRILITDYRSTLQVILTTVTVALIVEAIAVTDPKELMEKLYGYNKTWVQILILGTLIVTALASSLFLQWIETRFGQIFLVQLLGILVIISRLYVNVSAPSNNLTRLRREPNAHLGIMDEQRDTYAVYLFGLIAILLPPILQQIHTMRVIDVSSITLGTAVFFSIGYYAFYWWRDDYLSV